MRDKIGSIEKNVKYLKCRLKDIESYGKINSVSFNEDTYILSISATDNTGNTEIFSVDLSILNGSLFTAEVNTFADLPDPTISTGETYYVLNETGSWILGTRRRS